MNIIEIVYNHLGTNMLKQFFYLFKQTLFFFFLFIHYSAFGMADFPNNQFIQQKAEKKLKKIHSKLTLLHGSFLNEYPEQLMAAMFLSPHAKVLELGGNVGRNSCVIATILKHSENLVTMEPSEEYAQLLQENRDFNDLHFHIEVSALSKVPLIQQEWKTIPSETLLPGWTPVRTTTFDQLQDKYGLIFDTMVIDCEGAFYHILKEDPTILQNIKTIIIENDFFDDFQQLDFVQEHFRKYGLRIVYDQPLEVPQLTIEHFYQVWMK